MRAKVAVFGGTFNPIHHGHLRVALDLVQQVGFQKMLLVPCHLPVHRDIPTASSAQRATMTALALTGAGNEAFMQVDERELRRGSASYSVDTLTELRAEVGPECSLALVVGLDAYCHLPSWHRWRELLELAHIVVVARPGCSLPGAGELAEFDRVHRAGSEALEARAAGAVVHLNIRALDISATEIRALTARGQSTQYLLPDTVREYIQQQRLYGAS